MKKTIDVYEHMGEILKGVKSGVLITGKADDKVNSMTISWGMVGIEWGKPIFVTFIRENRFTRSLIEKTGEFTVSIPIDDSAKKILGFCGSKSGRDIDKAKEIGLTYEEPEMTSVPGVKELPLTLECKVVYKQAQDINAMIEENKAKFYPQDVDSLFTGSNKDTHVAYYGEIVKKGERYTEVDWFTCKIKTDTTIAEALALDSIRYENRDHEAIVEEICA